MKWVIQFKMRYESTTPLLQTTRESCNVPTVNVSPFISLIIIDLQLINLKTRALPSAQRIRLDALQQNKI